VAGPAFSRCRSYTTSWGAIEAGGGCAVCGCDRCLGNLHFHHVIPAEKWFEIQMGSGKSIAAYREEARKCVLVCANCHGEIEAGLIPSPAAGFRFRDSSEGGRRGAGSAAPADA
jgi:hypothetical protein